MKTIQKKFTCPDEFFECCHRMCRPSPYRIYYFWIISCLCGQYFYVPFLLKIPNLHVGPRSKESIYSGGQTSWQDTEEKEKSLNRLRFQNCGMDGLAVELAKWRKCKYGEIKKNLLKSY
jgi:hypothetical protein